MAKAEHLGNALWPQGGQATTTIQKEINKSAATQALLDLSETDATIAMTQAKRLGSQTEQATAQNTVAVQREMNKSAATQALEYLSDTEKHRIMVAHERCDDDPAIRQGPSGPAFRTRAAGALGTTGYTRSQ